MRQFTARLHGKVVVLSELNILSGNNPDLFKLLETDRKTITKVLLQPCEDRSFRERFANDIQVALLNGKLSLDALPLVKRAKWTFLERCYKTSKSALEKTTSEARKKIGPSANHMTIKELTNTLSSCQDKGARRIVDNLIQQDIALKQQENSMKEFCERKSIYIYYLKEGLGKNLPLNATAMLAYAEMTKVNLYIWQKDDKSIQRKSLILQAAQTTRLPRKTIHLLQTTDQKQIKFTTLENVTKVTSREDVDLRQQTQSIPLPINTTLIFNKAYQLTTKPEYKASSLIYQAQKKLEQDRDDFDDKIKKAYQTLRKPQTYMLDYRPMNWYPAYQRILDQMNFAGEDFNMVGQEIRKLYQELFYKQESNAITVPLENYVKETENLDERVATLRLKLHKITETLSRLEMERKQLVREIVSNGYMIKHKTFPLPWMSGSQSKGNEGLSFDEYLPLLEKMQEAAESKVKVDKHKDILPDPMLRKRAALTRPLANIQTKPSVLVAKPSASSQEQENLIQAPSEDKQDDQVLPIEAKTEDYQEQDNKRQSPLTTRAWFNAYYYNWRHGIRTVGLSSPLLRNYQYDFEIAAMFNPFSPKPDQSLTAATPGNSVLEVSDKTSDDTVDIVSGLSEEKKVGLDNGDTTGYQDSDSWSTAARKLFEELITSSESPLNDYKKRQFLHELSALYAEKPTHHECKNWQALIEDAKDRNDAKQLDLYTVAMELSINQLRQNFIQKWTPQGNSKSSQQKQDSKPVVTPVKIPPDRDLVDILLQLHKRKALYFEKTANGYRTYDGIDLKSFLSQDALTSSYALVLPVVNKQQQVSKDQLQLVIVPSPSLMTDKSLPTIKFVEFYKLSIKENGTQTGELTHTVSLAPRDEQDILLHADPTQKIHSFVDVLKQFFSTETDSTKPGQQTWVRQFSTPDTLTGYSQNIAYNAAQSLCSTSESPSVFHSALRIAIDKLAEKVSSANRLQLANNPVSTNVTPNWQHLANPNQSAPLDYKFYQQQAVYQISVQPHDVKIIVQKGDELVPGTNICDEQVFDLRSFHQVVEQLGNTDVAVLTAAQIVHHVLEKYGDLINILGDNQKYNNLKKLASRFLPMEKNIASEIARLRKELYQLSDQKVYFDFTKSRQLLTHTVAVNIGSFHVELCLGKENGLDSYYSQARDLELERTKLENAQVENISSRHVSHSAKLECVANLGSSSRFFSSSSIKNETNDESSKDFSDESTPSLTS